MLFDDAVPSVDMIEEVGFKMKVTKPMRESRASCSVPTIQKSFECTVTSASGKSCSTSGKSRSNSGKSWSSADKSWSGSGKPRSNSGTSWSRSGKSWSNSGKSRSRW